MTDTRQGSEAPRWDGGETLGSRGYVLVWVPEGHHLRREDGYAMRSRIVMERKLHRRLRAAEKVYHLDDDKQNDDPANLSLRRPSPHPRLCGCGAPARCRGKCIACYHRDWRAARRGATDGP